MSNVVQNLLVVAVIIVAGFIIYDNKETIIAELQLGEMQNIGIDLDTLRMRVDVADTLETRTRGLSGREQLKESGGMLFVFDTADYHSIWMKDMNFSIDIFWINAEGMIVGIEESVSPETFPDTFTPPEEVPFALETNSGIAATFEISVGDQIELPKWVLEHAQ